MLLQDENGRGRPTYMTPGVALATPVLVRAWFALFVPFAGARNTPLLVAYSNQLVGGAALRAESGWRVGVLLLPGYQIA